MAPTPDGRSEPKKTPYGEIVYQRAAENKDFKEKSKFAYFEGQRDEVLAENLLDVKNLLKNTSTS